MCDSDWLVCRSRVQGPKLWITMEYLGGGSVADMLKPGPIEEMFLTVILHEVLCGLDYLHSEHKIHRDIKGKYHMIHTDTNIIKYTGTPG